MLAHYEEIGLSSEEVAQVARIASQWRLRHAELVAEMVRQGTDIDQLLMEHHPDTTRIKQLASERRELMGRTEDEFLDAWAALADVLSEDQFSRTIAVYRREFADQPHPVLGTSAWEFAQPAKQLVGAAR